MPVEQAAAAAAFDPLPAGVLQAQVVLAQEGPRVATRAEEGIQGAARGEFENGFDSRRGRLGQRAGPGRRHGPGRWCGAVPAEEQSLPLRPARQQRVAHGRAAAVGRAQHEHAARAGDFPFAKPGPQRHGGIGQREIAHGNDESRRLPIGADGLAQDLARPQQVGRCGRVSGPRSQAEHFAAQRRRTLAEQQQQARAARDFVPPPKHVWKHLV
jgi:hypothetical protein